MSTDSQYIPALEAMQQINMPPDVFVALLRSHEAELPLFRNDEEMTIRKAIENMDFRCMFWRNIHRKFYAKKLHNPHTCLRYFKLYLPQWEQFLAAHKNEIMFELPESEQAQPLPLEYVEQEPLALPSSQEPEQPEPQVQADNMEPVEEIVVPPDETPHLAQAEQGVEAHIAAWEAVMPQLTRKERLIAKVVIEKWRGKSHLDCYMAVYDDDCIAEDSKIKKIYRAKNAAIDIAERYALQMPPWSEQE